MTDVTNFVEGKMERFLDYQKECNKLFALTEKRDIRDQIKVLVDKMEDKDLVPLKTSLMKSLLDEKIDELKSTSWGTENRVNKTWCRKGLCFLGTEHQIKDRV